MSDELVNQLTLNFLISKNQLHKLNKKIKEDASQIKNTDKEIYGERIKQVFHELFNNNPPDDLLFDVKHSFDLFLDKCIYYLKAHDTNTNLEKERVEIQDDIDFEKEERAIERGNYQEEYQDEDQDEDQDQDQDEDQDQVEDQVNQENQVLKPYSHPLINIKPKYTNKLSKSTGVEDIQKLPLDWFQNVRQNYKKNQIIPRKTEIVLGDGSFIYGKKKI